MGILGLERLVPFHRGLLGHLRRPEPYTEAEHVRLALEDLGTTFVKLGQVVSTRSDIVSPELQRELAKLQDQVPPEARTAIEEVLVEELGRPVEELFASFDWSPVAAGSIGQAHGAVLHDGTAVIVKVRRRGVVERVDEDLHILGDLAAVIARRLGPEAPYDAPELVDEFARTLRAELDYITEGHNAERLAQALAGKAKVHIPRIFWETTTSRVLTLERMTGAKVGDTAALAAAGIERQSLAMRLAQLYLTMVFDEGFFHADPHPGNYFIEPDGTIGLIDFGMVGTLEEATREQLGDIFAAIEGHDAAGMVDVLLDIGAARVPVDRVLLQRDVERLVAEYWGRPLAELAVGRMLENIFDVVRRHRLHLPVNLALVFKTWLMVEGVVAELAPGASTATYFAPYVKQVLARRYSPEQWLKRTPALALATATAAAEFPAHARRLIGLLERGTLEIYTRPAGYEPILKALETLTARLGLSIIAAAFINALAVLMIVYHPSGWERWAGPAFIFGFAAAAILSAFAVLTLQHARRR
ncbi:AarF/ABC1/UbiB kinase family protein [bacterium]|nr:MAG: AarF/ABC1/UbiB kinase family protein [bacterium]